jgi:hypothetical protein
MNLKIVLLEINDLGNLSTGASDECRSPNDERMTKPQSPIPNEFAFVLSLGHWVIDSSFRI